MQSSCWIGQPGQLQHYNFCAGLEGELLLIRSLTEIGGGKGIGATGRGAAGLAPGAGQGSRVSLRFPHRAICTEPPHCSGTAFHHHHHHVGYWLCSLVIIQRAPYPMLPIRLQALWVTSFALLGHLEPKTRVPKRSTTPRYSAYQCTTLLEPHKCSQTKTSANSNLANIHLIDRYTIYNTIHLRA